MRKVLQQTAETIVSTVQPLVARIHAIITHFEPHDDELLARWFLRTFGAELLPGICSAVLQLVDSGLRTINGRTGAEWFTLGYPCLGVGGPPLDEHGLSPVELENSSAATLAAKMLHIEQYGPVQVMLAHAVRVDRTATASAFDVSAMVKSWHRSGVPTKKVCWMYDRIADAWFTVLSGRVRNPAWQKRPTFDQLAAEWIVNHLAPEGFDRSRKFATAFDAAEALEFQKIRNLRQLLKSFSTEYKNAIQGVLTVDRLFDMHGTVDALNQDNASEKDIRDIVFTSMQAKWDEQIRFMEGYDKLEALKKAGTLYSSSYQWRIIQIISDNPDINRAARSLDPHHDVFMQWSTDGHFIAWYNKDKIDMDRVIAGLRRAELKAVGKPCDLTWEQLTSEGTLPEVPQWYYNPVNGQIMNGSRTNQDKPKTKLSITAVLTTFKNGMTLSRITTKTAHAETGFANTPRITTET